VVDGAAAGGPSAPRGGQEGLRHRDTGKRCFEVLDVGLHSGMADIRQGPGAEDLPGVGRGAAEAASRHEVFRKFRHVAAGDQGRPLVRLRWPLFPASEALADIGRKAALRFLTVVDNVDAGRDLLLDNLRHRAPYPSGEGLLVVRLPGILCHEHVPQVIRPWEAAGMRGQDALVAPLHCLPLSAYSTEDFRGCHVCQLLIFMVFQNGGDVRSC